MPQNYIEEHQHELVLRIIACRFSLPMAVNFVNRLKIWERHHGTKWVVNRLKAFQQHLLGKAVPGLKLHPDGTIYGDFRPLSKKAKKNRKGLINSLRVCKLYGLFEAKPPTEKDYHSFSIMVGEERPFVREATPVELTPEDMWLAGQAYKQARFCHHYPMDETSAPLWNMKSKPVKEFTFLDHGMTFSNFPRLVLDHYDFVSKVFKIQGADFFERRLKEGKPDQVGKVIGLTKDRGMKIRFIANPFRTIQQLLSRLKSATENLLRDLPESCVFDQEKGVKWAVDQLSKGKKLSSVDLTSCTDFLPLEGQLLMLNTLFPLLSEDISIFHKVSRSVWKTKYEGVDVKWVVGQPLGTGPSFSVFTLYHLFLVRTLGGDATNFRIIGDDIVMSSEALTSRYVRLMEKLCVPISESKSLFNMDMAEFAGRILDKYGNLPVFKASPTDWVNDPLGLIRQYGSASLKMTPKNLRNLIKYSSSLPAPFGFGLRKEDLSEIPPEVFLQYMRKLALLETNFEIQVTEDFPYGKPRLKDGVTASGLPEWLVHMAFPPRPCPLDEDEPRNVRYHDQGPVIGQGIWSIHLVKNQLLIDHINDNIKDVPEENVSEHLREVHKSLSTERSTFKAPSEDRPKLGFLRKLWKIFKRNYTKS